MAVCRDPAVAVHGLAAAVSRVVRGRVLEHVLAAVPVPARVLAAAIVRAWDNSQLQADGPDQVPAAVLAVTLPAAEGDPRSARDRALVDRAAISPEAEQEHGLAVTWLVAVVDHRAMI